MSRYVVELFTVEDMEAFLKREEVNCTTERLLIILITCGVFKSPPDPQKSKLTGLISPVLRKPPEVLISVGGWYSAPADIVEVFNFITFGWVLSQLKKKNGVLGPSSPLNDQIEEKKYLHWKQWS